MIEISDIITLPPVMIIHALTLSAISVYMNYRYIMISPLIFLVTIVLASTGVNAVHNEVLGEYVIRDQGQSYIYVAYSELLIVLFANIAGVSLGVMRKQIKKGQETTDSQSQELPITIILQRLIGVGTKENNSPEPISTDVK